MIQSIPVTPRTVPQAADAGDRQAHVACQDFSFFYGDNQAVKKSGRTSGLTTGKGAKPPKAARRQSIVPRTRQSRHARQPW